MTDGTVWFNETGMTRRGPKTLSRHYGFGSVEACADSLPAGANILDAGAGASTFGHTLAAMRPDIHWTNLDKAYTHAAALALLQKRAPPNLTFLTGDITEAATLLPRSSFDVVFSFCALMYLGQEQARTGVKQLMDVAKPTGKLAVGILWMAGPAEPGLWGYGEDGHTITVCPSEDPSFRSAVADHISEAVHSPPVPPLEGATYAKITDEYSIQDYE